VGFLSQQPGVNKMLVTRKLIVALVITSESCKTPVTIFPHEVPILEAMYGGDDENKVIEVTDIDPGIPAKEFDTVDEYSRLQQYYKGSNELPNPTRAVFRNLKEFEDGFEDDDGGDDEQKDALLAQAKELGIKANKNWGAKKLQEAIDAKLAE
jgi:hypothetical protein